MNRRVKLVICLFLSISCTLSIGCTNTDKKSKVDKETLEKIAIYKNKSYSTGERVKDLIGRMQMDEKIGQMIQVARDSKDASEISKYNIGSILSGGGSTPNDNSPKGWIEMIKGYQQSAADTRLGIPIIYGVDAVHGHDIVMDAVVFPHNIGLGAANNTELMKNIATVTAEEMLSTGITYNFGPCVAVPKDLRWGRYYEGYSENPELVKTLSSVYIKQLQSYGIAATAKHFIADGATIWGTGDSGYKIDQGNTIIEGDKLLKEELSPYEEAVKSGVKSVMVSFSSINGIKNHSNKHLITDILKEDLGFKGIVISDWEGVHQINASNFNDQVIIAINAGIDMMMEQSKWKETYDALKAGVEDGKISKERIDDAVTRILTVKFDLGLFENNLGNSSLIKNNFNSPEHRKVAETAVTESMVLLKNNGILPLKKNSKIFVTGPAANSVGIQCGGWTIDWQGNQRQPSGVTILEGFEMIAKENGGTIITDITKAKEADVTVVVIGEESYAEGKGDDGTLGLGDGMALEGNIKSLNVAKKLNNPIVTIMVSGRPRIISDNLKEWSALVEAWLPGSEGEGVAKVIYGEANFKGKLPVTWPKSNKNLPIKEDNILFPIGYGLKY
ncbi:glycoside hydrolase family 3 protein [Clostridium sp. CF012]|uniref:glycoside hydrolase family 3 protein n=1 Tax=Clostridium sp. CF012 TaxID=2843319 RepID=UPI001C0E1F65|nr:glycoside hydrolase family 3 protein [Clostridium sp. CF012]MBU3143893.1 glycoside hydrolase family 3 protein [Clostridium sp. CF012]